MLIKLNGLAKCFCFNIAGNGLLFLKKSYHAIKGILCNLNLILKLLRRRQIF